VTEQLWRGYSGRLSTLLAVGWATILLGREAIPPLLPNIIGTLGISTAQAGLALTVMWVVYAVSQYPGGRFSDQLSRTAIIVVGLAIAVGGFLLLTTVATFLTFMIGVATVGVGAGLYFPANRGLLSDLFVARRGQAFGIQIAAGSIGSALAAGVAVAALGVATWQAAFLPSILLLSVVLVLVLFESEEPSTVSRRDLDGLDLGVRETLERIFTTREMRWLVVSYSLFAFAWQGSLGFLPAFLQAEKGLSPALAGAVFAMLYLVGMVVGPVAGNVGDRLGRVGVAAGMLSVGMVGLGGLLLAGTAPTVVGSVLVFALGMRGFPPVMQAFVLDVFPDESMAGDFGALKTIYTGFGALGPAYIGFVADQWGYTVAYVGPTGCLLVGVVIVGWLSRRF
jgi:MFS family permease